MKAIIVPFVRKARDDERESLTLGHQLPATKGRRSVENHAHAF